MVSVSLRPLEEEDLAVFELTYATRDGSGHYQWFGFSPPGRGLEEMGAIGPDGGRLTVLADRQVAGSAYWFRREWGPPATCWCWEIALHVHAEHRGRAIGTQAIASLVTYLFDHTLVWRIQAITDTSNLTAQRLLSRAGFTSEGILRAAQWREGARHDQVIYSILRGDPRPEPARTNITAA